MITETGGRSKHPPSFSRKKNKAPIETGALSHLSVDNNIFLGNGASNFLSHMRISKIDFKIL